MHNSKYQKINGDESAAWILKSGAKVLSGKVYVHSNPCLHERLINLLQTGRTSPGVEVHETQ